jgi:cytochrome c553
MIQFSKVILAFILSSCVIFYTGCNMDNQSTTTSEAGNMHEGHDHEQTVGSGDVNLSVNTEELKEYGCLSCHSLDGSEGKAPTYKGLWGKSETVIVDGEEQQIIVDEQYLKESVTDPNAKIVKGYNAIMPSYKGQLSEDEIDQIVKIMKEIK